MIENMLFLARADHAQVALDQKSLDARAELDKVAEYFDAVAAERDLTLTITGAATVHADQTLLRRAITNLLDNALRHAPAGTTVKLAVLRARSGHTDIRIANAGPRLPRRPCRTCSAGFSAPIRRAAIRRPRPASGWPSSIPSCGCMAAASPYAVRKGRPNSSSSFLTMRPAARPLPRKHAQGCRQVDAGKLGNVMQGRAMRPVEQRR